MKFAYVFLLKFRFSFLFITFHSACKSNFVKSLKTKISDIPQFRGHVANNMYNKIVDTIKKTG